jgi:hypothetical protein
VELRLSFVAKHGKNIANLPLLTQGVNVPATTGSGSSNLTVSSTDKQLNEERLMSKASHAMPHGLERSLTASHTVASVTCPQAKVDVASDDLKVRRRGFSPRTQVRTEQYVDMLSELCGHETDFFDHVMDQSSVYICFMFFSCCCSYSCKTHTR